MDMVTKVFDNNTMYCVIRNACFNTRFWSTILKDIINNDSYSFIIYRSLLGYFGNLSLVLVYIANLGLKGFM